MFKIIGYANKYTKQGNPNFMVEPTQYVTNRRAFGRMSRLGFSRVFCVASENEVYELRKGKYGIWGEQPVLLEDLPDDLRLFISLLD